MNKTRDDEWNASRWKELELMIRSLRTAGSLDSANRIIKHIQELEKALAKLDHWARITDENPRQSFFNFLRDQARFAYKHRKELRKLREADERAKQ